MTAQVLVIQQVDHEPAALIGEILKAKGMRLQQIVATRDPIPHHAEEYCAVVIMGGPASASDGCATIRQQLQLIRWCLAHNTPLLGICLGAQLMAKAAGGAIIPSPLRELGWYPLMPTAAAGDDPLLQHLANPTYVFQWHGESFTLQDSATLLASCPQVPQQAFRLGRAQYGLQFHVEIDANLIETWIEHGSDERAYLGDQGLQQLNAETSQYIADANALCRQMIASWVSLLNTGP